MSHMRGLSMIKLIALITMLVDHIGAIFFPDIIILRIIGRISMPLFAFCIARGYYYSKQKGTLIKYTKNLLLFAVISEVPYLFSFEGLNIGVTWLLSIILLTVIDTLKKSKSKIIVLMISIIVLFITNRYLNIDYGIYGILTPILYYYFLIKGKKEILNFFTFLLLTLIYIPVMGKEMIIQIFSCIGCLIIPMLEKIDALVKLPKKIYYVIYPLHLLIFGIIKGGISL